MNLVLSAVLFTICGWIVRIYPWAPYSPFRGRYTPGVNFATWYTIQSGVLPGVLPSTSYTSNLTNGTTYLGEFGRALLNAPLLLMIGKTGLTDSLTFYAQFPWQGLVLLPSALVLGVHAMSRLGDKPGALRAHELGYLLTYGLALLGFPSLLQFTSNSGITDYYGWVFVGLVFYSLVRRASTPTSRTKFTALLILFMTELLIYHHTTALFLGLLLFCIYLAQARMVLEKLIVERNIVVIYGVLFISYVAFLTFSFRGYLTSLTSALGNLAEGILGIAVPSPLARIATTNDFTLDRVLARSADLGLIVVTFSYFGIAFLRRRATGLPGVALVGFVLGTTVASVFVVAWGGFGAFFIRISALSAVVAILGVAYVLRHSGTTAKRAFVALSVAVIILSPIAYETSHAAQGGALRWSEASTLTWTDAYVSKNTAILSDSRVASPLIYYGFTSPVGFEDETANHSQQEKLAQAYFDLYQPANSDQIARGICTIDAVSGTSVRLLVYSTYFQDPGTSVIGFLNSYPPANPNATKILDNTTILQRIFDSGTTRSYGLVDKSPSC